MSNEQTNVIIKEYYGIVTPLLSYVSCEKTALIERSIVNLLCKVKQCDESTDELWRAIEEARCLQTNSDGAILLSSDHTHFGVVFDIKMEMLKKCCVAKLKIFDDGLFVNDLKESANMGWRASCKLLAFLNWLGIIVPQNHDVARNIWSVLATNGDLLSMKMLIYAFEQDGEHAQSQKWSHIFEVLMAETDSFSPCALCSKYREYAEEEVQFANIIMFVKQTNSIKDSDTINRPMIHYIIHSKDDYIKKMERLSSETNYYLAMYIEDTYSNKKLGF